MQAVITSRADASRRVRAENPISLEQAAAVFPRGDRWRSVSIASLIRWIVAGRGKVRLDAVRIRGQWHTSVAAITRFVGELDRRDTSSADTAHAVVPSA